MKYWKEITWDDVLNPGDILMCSSPAIYNVVVVKRHQKMTRVTKVMWIQYGHMDGIVGYWTFDYVIKYCKKLIEV